MKIIHKVTGEVLDVVDLDYKEQYLTVIKLPNRYVTEGVESTMPYSLEPDAYDAVLRAILIRLIAEDGLSEYAILDQFEEWANVPEDYIMRLYLTDRVISLISANYIDMMLKVKDNLKVRSGNGYYCYLRSLDPTDTLVLGDIQVPIEYRP